MLIKILFYFVIYRWIIFIRELGKLYFFGWVDIFFFGFGFGIIVLGIMGLKLNLVNFEREWCCGWRMEGGVIKFSIVVFLYVIILLIFVL